MSHPGSRFTVSQGPQGLAVQLQRRFPGSHVTVSTRNPFDESGEAVTERSVQLGLSAELKVELEWARFLRRGLGARWWANYAARWMKRLGKRVSSPGPVYIRRLLNIEFAHLYLLQAGLDSGAPWLLMLEDDAFSDNVDDLAAGLASLMNAPSAATIIHLSDSFTTKELGISHLLTKATTDPWGGDESRETYSSELPATNTVCAIAYSRSLAHAIVAELRSMPLEPVLPIDWKLNKALMALVRDEEYQEIKTLFVQPAPVTQMSMK